MPDIRESAESRGDPPSRAASGSGMGAAQRVSGSGSGSFVTSDDVTLVSDSTLHPEPKNPVPYEKPSIDGYELHGEVHRGGQGIVYRATQLGTKRVVALKVLLEGPFASEAARRRFEREVELAASLRHPSIVTVLDSGMSRGRTYFAMEFIEGQRLDHFLRSGEPSLTHTLTLFERICDAVNFAHQRGVIHRDLKPSNILVDSQGVPHILDFGLAKMERSKDPEETVAVLSTTGQVVGTLAYMSPEQAAGSELVDVRSDVYSLGVIFYEALLGRTPYSISGALGEILNRIAQDDPAPPRSLRTSSRFGRMIDDEIGTILLKTLEKDAARRYQTAGDLGRDLRHYLANEPIEAKRASGLYMLKKTLRRYRLQAAVAGLILAMLLGFLIIFAVLYRSESRLRGEAETLRTLAAQKAEKAEASAQVAASAEERARADRARAESNEESALRSAEQLRLALVQQRLQRGDLARARGDLAEAREAYWEAFNDAPDAPAARWPLRQYYLESGDRGATQLTFGDSGAGLPIAFSPDGELAALCDASNSIALKHVGTGQTIGWRGAPGAVRVLEVRDDGRVCAAGDEWVRVWSISDWLPEISIDVPGGTAPILAHVMPDGAGVAVVAPPVFRVYDRNGATLVDARISELPRGTPDVSDEYQAVAIPTEQGVVLCSGDKSGAFRSQLVWKSTPERAARAVRFVPGQQLAVLSDGIDLVQLAGEKRGEVSRYLTLRESWDRFDLANGVTTLALGSRDGRAALYEAGDQVAAWRVTQGWLRHVQLTHDGAKLLTLDDRGSLTRWAPPQADEDRVVVHGRPAADWVVSADGSSVLFRDESGKFFHRGLRDGATSTPIVLPALSNLLSGADATTSLSLSGDGGTALIRSGDRVWVRDMTAARIASLRWGAAGAATLEDATLSDDGATAALQLRSGDKVREMIRFLPTRADSPALPRLAGDAPGVGLAFSGSAIRFVRFIPKSSTALLARANGELHLVDSAQPSDGQRGVEVVRSSAAWEVLDSPAYLASFDRGGLYVALACDDGLVRVLSILDTSEVARFPVGRDVRSISFDASADLLLVRSSEGAVSLFDVQTQSRAGGWNAAAGARALVAWAQAGDSLLINEPAGIVLHRFAAVDERIDANRSYALERQIARRLSEGDSDAAAVDARRLRERDEPRGRAAQEAIVEQRLRKVRGATPQEALAEVLPGASSEALIRLASAAYAGERYDIAHDIFEQAASRPGAQLDPWSARSRAECLYLRGQYDRAADELGALEGLELYGEREAARLSLTRVAALIAAGRVDAARIATGEFQARLRPRRTPPAALVAASISMQVLVERNPDARVAGMLRAISTVFADAWKFHRDDVEFFAGESARLQGETAAARTHYDLCAETARDPWPAGWARYRLEQSGESE
jgi:tRNA A-37 threonylcarbamoyl transferase component Bud32